MLSLQWFPPYTIDWQHLVCLLYCLRQLRGENSRFDTMLFIRNSCLLSFNHEDNNPYGTQNEPSWQTDIAWARKNGVLMGLVSNNARDSWGLTRDGIATIDHLLERGQIGEIVVGRCFLWSPRLKNIFNPKWVASSSDSQRPPKKHRSDFDSGLNVGKAIIDSGAADSVAKQLSERLGRTVRPNMDSLADAIKEYLAQRQ